jgi:hypothetical protein
VLQRCESGCCGGFLRFGKVAASVVETMHLKVGTAMIWVISHALIGGGASGSSALAKAGEVW